MKLRVVLSAAMFMASLLFAAQTLTGTEYANADVCCDDTDNCPAGTECRLPMGGDTCSPESVGECVRIPEE